MSPLSKRVQAAGVQGVERKVLPSRILPEDFFRDLNEVRDRFGRLVAAPPDSIAVIPAVSYGMAVVARNLSLAAGQNIVVAGRQFPSNVYVWRRLADDAGAEVRVVAGSASFPRGEAWNEALVRAIDSATALVALGNVHWADGTRFDLARIGERARAVGAAFVIDGAQSVGAVPTSVEELKPDALICPAYKWLLGPYSIGLAYFGPRFRDGRPLEEGWMAREGSEDFSGLTDYEDRYRSGAVRYDVGAAANFVLVPMLLEGLRHFAAWDPQAVAEYTQALLDPFAAEVAAAGFVSESRAWRAPHILGLELPDGLDPREVAARLAERNVHVSVRGTVLRVSPHLYNDAEDLCALRDALVGS